MKDVKQWVGFSSPNQQSRKVWKVVCNLNDQKVNQYLSKDINTLKKCKKWFWKIFFELINIAVFKKATQNVQKHRNANLVIKRFSRRNYLISDFNHQTMKEFWKKPLALEIKKIGVIMNKLVYLGSPNFKLIKNEMRKILYNCVNKRYSVEDYLWFLGTGKFINYTKT